MFKEEQRVEEEGGSKAGNGCNVASRWGQGPSACVHVRALHPACLLLLCPPPHQPSLASRTLRPPTQTPHPRFGGIQPGAFGQLPRSGTLCR